MTHGEQEKAAKTEHAPEPWRIGAMESGMSAIDGHDGSEVTGFISPEDARRIVACVNACKGISIEDLEMDNAKFVQALRERQALREQRDELLVAIERLSFAAMCRDSTMGDPCRLIEVRAELAAANEQACVTIASVRGSAA